MAVYMLECEFYLRLAVHDPVVAPSPLDGDSDQRYHSNAVARATWAACIVFGPVQGRNQSSVGSGRHQIKREDSFSVLNLRGVIGAGSSFAICKPLRHMLIHRCSAALPARALDRFTGLLPIDVRQHAEDYGPTLPATPRTRPPRCSVRSSIRAIATSLSFGKRGSGDLAVTDSMVALVKPRWYAAASSALSRRLRGAKLSGRR